MRVGRIWEERLAPALRAGKNVLVVSHGNSLRALIKMVDGVGEWPPTTLPFFFSSSHPSPPALHFMLPAQARPHGAPSANLPQPLWDPPCQSFGRVPRSPSADGDSAQLDMPTAAPLIYGLDASLRPINVHGFWGDSSVARHGYFLLDDTRIRQAQKAMREQVLLSMDRDLLHRGAGGTEYRPSLLPNWEQKSCKREQRYLTLLTTPRNLVMSCEEQATLGATLSYDVGSGSYSIEAFELFVQTHAQPNVSRRSCIDSVTAEHAIISRNE